MQRSMVFTKVVSAFFLMFASAVLPLGAQEPSSPKAGLSVIDTIPNFLAFWSKARSQPESEQVQLFRHQVIGAHPELFVPNIVYMAQDEGPQAENRWIGNWLRGSRSLIPVIAILDQRLTADLPALTVNFQRTFPDFRKDGRVYFTLSLNSFDGQRDVILDHPSVLFGLDVIAKNSGTKANLAITFDHELFDLYHVQLWPALTSHDAQLWQAVWGEGLASYVSWKMNPNASLNEALLDPVLAERAEKVLPALATDLLKNFHSTDDKLGALYFSGGNPASTIPDRAGYYVGFFVAAQLGQTRTLQELAHLQGQELELDVRTSLESLALGKVIKPSR